MRRRNYALGRMADEGFITREQAPSRRRRSRSSPPAGRISTPSAPFFVEEVRQHLEDQLRRPAALRERSVGLHVARPEAAARRRAGARRRPAPDRSSGAASASRRNVAAERRRDASRIRAGRRGARRRRAAGRRVDRRRRHRRRRAARARPRRRAARRARPRRLRVDRQDHGRVPEAAATSSACTSTARRCRRGHDRRHARSGAGVRRRGARHPQPHGPHARDGRRPRASIAAASTAPPRRCGSSARPSSRSSTRRPSIAASRRVASCMDTPGVVVGRGRSAALRADELRQAVRGPDHAAPRRSSSRATCRPSG